MNNDIKLGMDLQKLSEKWAFKEIVSFIKGETDSCLSYYELKPLYDKYGYYAVNKAIKELWGKQEEAAANDKTEI